MHLVEVRGRRGVSRADPHCRARGPVAVVGRQLAHIQHPGVDVGLQHWAQAARRPGKVRVEAFGEGLVDVFGRES